MIKRKISLILAVFMLFTIFTGCDVNELGYMKLSAEVSKLTQLGIKNTTQIEISKEITGRESNVKLDIDIQGDVNIVDINKPYLDLDIKFKLDNKVNINPIKLILIEDKIYVSKNILSEILKFKDDLNLELDEVDILVFEKLIEETKDFQYIALPNLNYIVPTDEFISPTTNVTYKDSNALVESARNYITKVFKGFESKLIKKTNDGYIMELNAADVWSLISRLVEYINQNKELIFDETILYLEALYANMEIKNSDEEDIDIKSLIEELKDQKQDFYNAIDELYSAIKTMETEEKEELDELIDMFGESYLKNEIYKNGNVYKQNLDAQFMFEGILAGNIKSKTTITPKNVNKTSVPNKVITTEELEKLNKKIEDIYNPITEVTALWVRNSSDKKVKTDSFKSNNKTSNQAELPYVLIDGRVYLPMRYICEEFGEEIEWDAANNKAYVIRGNKKIDMTGIVTNGKTMIKVRDFEKLGYKVEYIEDEVFALVRIIKIK